MKLKKYENKELRKSKIISFVFCSLSIALLILFVYQSYARYQDRATFRIINGKLKMSGGKGDIEFAFYNGDQKLNTLPLKDSGSVFLKSVCTNNATVKWDSENWVPTVYNLTETKTSCELYFGSKEDSVCSLYPEGATCKYYKAGETEELLYDDTEDKNLRYVGATPNNYVYFNCEEGKEASKSTCETWRIIGFMNNIEDDNGVVGSHIKIIRDSIGNYSWDSTESGVNNGYGINEWSTSAIEKVLNDEYLNRAAGSNLCYKDEKNATTTCPTWTNIGIREEARNMISSVKWNTGTFEQYNNGTWTAKYMYEKERSNYDGKSLCQNGTYCNDRVIRTTIWIGKIGLMYPSDYGYAVGTEVREICLEKSMLSYNSNSCMTFDWLRNTNNHQWTITPVPLSSTAFRVFCVNMGGVASDPAARTANAIRPTLYLKSDVKIIDRDYEDYGSIDHPFELSYE